MNELTQIIQEYDLSTVLATVSEEIRRRQPDHATDTLWCLVLGNVDVARSLAVDAETREEQMSGLARLFATR